MNLASDILDEIALEGLDGITIEALWVRLMTRKDFLLPPKDEHSKTYIWNIVRRLKDIEFYQLEQPRLPLVIFDRWSYMEDELGIVTEPNPIPVDIYPHCLISDTVNNIQGSCCTYYTREKVSFIVRKLQLPDIFAKYGAERIVIAANQSTRRLALMGPHQIPQLELTDFQYCCLERVGRSRYHGEVTQGRMGLQVLGVDSKTIYYFRKFLMKQKLITHQLFHMRARNVSVGGRLIHLPRFFRTVKPKFVTLTETIIDFLMTQPEYMCELYKLKEVLGISCSLKKLIKLPEFQRYVKTDNAPYRALYPDADLKDWKQKNSEKEKQLHVLYLVDPTSDLKEIKRKLEGEDEDDDEEDGETHSHGFLDQSPRCLDRPVVLQVWKVLEDAGPNGLSASELTKVLGMSKLNVRAICKNMLKNKLIGSFMLDVARQRVTRYFVNSGNRLCDVTAEFTSEELKFTNLTNNDNNLGNIKNNLTNNDDKLGNVKDNLTNNDNKLGNVKDSSGEGCSKNFVETVESTSTIIIPPGDDNDNDVSLLMTVNEEHDEVMKNIGEGSGEKKKKVREVEIVEEKEKRGVEKEDVDGKEGGRKEESKKEEEEGGGGVIGRGEENDENEESNSKVLERSRSGKKSLKRAKNTGVETGSPSPKKLKLKVKTIVELNNEKKIDENVVEKDSEPMDVSLESSSDKTGDLEVSSVRGDLKEHESCKIDVEISDDLNWLRLRGKINKDTDGYKTVRSLKRWNWVLETVQSLKVINNLKDLQAVIDEKETGEGLNSRIDRKSLLRILYRMAVDKFIKVYKVLLKSGDNVQEINFICNSSVAPDDNLIKLTIDLAKLKFSSKVKLQSDTATKQENRTPMQSAIKEEMVLTNKFDFSDDHKSNLDVPKFMRMRYLHIFMYYLLYGYEGSVDLDQKEAADQIRSMQCSEVDDLESMSFIYVPNICWKMFVPPLPQHREYKTGWALLADIILRLPLSMFIKLVRLTYIIPNLELYVDHPIKRHTLVKDLPIPIRNCLTFKRKYVFSIYEVMSRLAYIGLVQMGPQSHKDKDHVYVYLNRNALLLDTKSSGPGYHKISEDIDYSEVRYCFDTVINVEQYWLDMWKICMHTKLGSRSCVIGTELIMEDIKFKPDMIDILKARTREEVVEKDVGYLPGDRLGAAGFDSALFSHLKRNWSFKPFPRAPQRVFTLPNKPNTNAKNLFKFSEGRNQMVYSLLAKRRKNLIVTARKQSVLTAKNTVHRKQLLSHKPRVTVRQVKPKRNSRQRRPFYDQVDREALLRMNKLRVDWTKAEDKLLLLCKVVQTMIEPQTKSAILGNTSIPSREILHKTFPASRNKTSRACQRRTNYMLRSQSTCHSLNLCIEELRHDPTIMQSYGDLFEKLKAKYENKNKVIENKAKLIAEWSMHFKNLFELLAKRFDNFSMLSLSSVTTTMPDTLEEFYAQYNVIEPAKKVKAKHRFNPVQSINDVYCSVINSTIHSALCCSSDKTSWSFHLFSVYQQYPERILRAALAKMRTSLMVSLKRAWSRTKMRSGNYLPLTASPYRLSISYINLMSAKFTFDIFAESYELMKTIVEAEQIELQTTTGGATAGVVHLVTDDLVDFEIKVPDQVIVLNPNVQKKDEKYTRLMKRYQEILSSYKQELLTTSCLFQKDNYSTVNSIEGDKFADEDILTNNTIARSASRIALYLVKDSEENGGLVPQDLQHVHDFFVVNSCKVLSNVRPNLTEYQLKIITDMHDIRTFQKRLKENVLFPGNVMTDLNVKEVLKENFTGESFEIAVKLMELAKSEGNLGLLCRRIVDELGNCLVVKQILDELCRLKLLLCTGVVYTTYVHYKHVRPWLVHTYQNKRKDRESRMPMIGGVMDLGKEEEEEEERIDERTCREVSSGRTLQEVGRMDGVDKEDARKEKRLDGYVEGDVLVVEQDEEEEKEGEEEEMYVVDVVKSGKTSENKKENDRFMEVNCENVLQEDKEKEEEMMKKDEENLGGNSCRKEEGLEEGDKEKCEKVLKENKTFVTIDASCGEEGLVQCEKEEFDTKLNEKNTDESCSRKEASIEDEEENNEGMEVEKLIESTTEKERLAQVEEQKNDEDLREVNRIESVSRVEKLSHNDKEQNDTESEQTIPDKELSVLSFKDVDPGEGCSKDIVCGMYGEKERMQLNDENSTKRDHSDDEIGSSSCRKKIRLEDNSTTVADLSLKSRSNCESENLTTITSSLTTTSNFESDNLTIVAESSLTTRSNSETENFTTIASSSLTTTSISESENFTHIAEYSLKSSSISELENLTTIAESSIKTRSNCESDNLTTVAETSRKPRSNSISTNVVQPSTSKDTDNRNLSNPIKILLRPWVKIDGSINRRSLDYMLTTVLSHIMLHPLSTLAELQERFLPALQPQHTRELAELLQQIKCIDSYVFEKIGTVSLFSKPCEVVLKKATGLEPASEIRYEAERDAIVNLGKLISTKQYSEGFLTMLLDK